MVGQPDAKPKPFHFSERTLASRSGQVTKASGVNPAGARL